MRKIILLLVIFLMKQSASASVALPWTFTSNTGNMLTVAVPISVAPQINGRALQTGDAIGFFYKSGSNYVCAGYEVWTGSNLGVTLWGDNDQTTAKDGFSANDTIYIKVWDGQSGAEINATATYNPGSVLYSAGSFSVMATLTLQSNTPVVIPVPWTFSSNTGNMLTVAIPNNILPIINSRSFQTGDAIGFFYKSGSNFVCAGYEMWTGSNLGVTLWGDNDQTTAKDGFSTNDTIYVKVWDGQSGTEINATATYNPGSVLYNAGSFSVMTSLQIGGNVPSYAISGYIKYRNSVNTKLNGAKVKLYQDTTFIKEAIADTSGLYNISGLPNGTYRLELSTSKARLASCFNIQDVALIRMFVGLVLQFDTLQIKATNVNMDYKNGKPYVNIQDVSILRMKNGGLSPTTWIIPDWLFAIETSTNVFKNDMNVIINGANQIVNIKALCSGDVNGSFIPAP